ncbi:IQ and ubiquitin-like domain-containing protein isoform X1 [Anneissia japonica]|uniref:IQ and ubiquitin-like domain-containing protein isoform X1 n=1 Tax=Anneissia japonica TaxID=1529436 RepID=UPI001425AB77|nr:IQ and ubiquitin-like domain-containing protein isoform X1 [Anneissia japonica]
MSENEREKQTDDKNDVSVEGNGNPTEANGPEGNARETTEEVDATQEPNNEIIEGRNDHIDNEDKPPTHEGETEKEISADEKNEDAKEDNTSNETDKPIDKENQNEGTDKPANEENTNVDAKLPGEMSDGIEKSNSIEGKGKKNDGDIEKPTEVEPKETNAEKGKSEIDDRIEELKEGGEDINTSRIDEPVRDAVDVDGGASTAIDSATADEGKIQEASEAESKEKGEVETTGMGTDVTNEQHETDPHAASPQPSMANATSTVKFVLMPSGQVHTMACALNQTMQDLKVHFASELRMTSDKLVFMYDGKGVDNNLTLADLGVGPNGAVQMEISSSDPVNNPLKQLKPKPEYIMPDVITVKVLRENGEFEDVVVEIERSMARKPFIGGYRHRLSGVEFHHAAAQTRPKARPDNGIEKFCRDTQTVNEKNQRQQTMVDTSTQMTAIGCYVANMTDKLMVPGKYQSAHEYHTIILQKVIILQSYFRRWQAKRIVAGLKVDLAKRLEWERMEEIRKIKEKEDRIRREFERRMNPKTKEDFDLLYHALEKWRQEELAAIDSSMSGAKRKAALCHLLDQETQLLASIGRHKLEADTDNKQQAIQKFLDTAAGPKRWKAFDGRYTEMDTAYTIRAKELRNIYNSLNMRYLTQDERLDVLLTLKHTVKEHDCKLTQEIIELIDREADLLMRGVKESNLDGLRKRISTLFMQYIKTPTFNPEAGRLLKVPQDPSTLRKNIYFCPSCNSYLPSTEFLLSSNSKVVGKCRCCTKIDNDGRLRQDFSHYHYMLKSLRKAEEAIGDGSRIPFLLQETDLRYLVENIWNCQSTLSAWNDLFDLAIVRWDTHEHWSPWNCILLTKDEAKAHFKIDELEKGYGHVFCHKIKTKHTLAKNYFSRLPGMADHIQMQSKSGNHRKTIQSRQLTVSQA